MRLNKFTQELSAISGGFLKTDVDLKPYSYLKTGGVAQHFIQVSDQIVAQEEGESDLVEKTLNRLIAIIDFLVREGKPYQILGKGTNVIIKEGIVETVVIHLDLENLTKWVELKETDDPERRLLRLPASLPLIRAIKTAYHFHLQGLEFFLGIPGTIGGAVTMNAGVKELETKNVLTQAMVLRNHEIQTLRQEDLNMSYRHSDITKKDIIIQADFKLKKVSSKKVKELKKQNLKSLEERKRTQPLNFPSVGSTFKNPLPDYAGALIEKCGLKNQSYGNIRVSPLHANFIINDGGGTSDQALHLIEIVREEVFNQTGIYLKMEVQKFGF